VNTAPIPPAPPRASLGADLKRRVPSAIAMGLAALAATWYGGAPFLLLWLVAALVVWFEWASVVRAAPQTIVFAAGALSLAGAGLLVAESDSVAAATGSQLPPFAALRLRSRLSSTGCQGCQGVPGCHGAKVRHGGTVKYMRRAPAQRL